MDIKMKYKLPDGREFEEPISSAPPPVEVVVARDMKDLGRTSYKRIGQCIYCSSQIGLSKEHIIPYGLCANSPGGNNPVLLKASCERCRKVTSGFETTILRGSIRAVRVFRKLMSRSKHAQARVTESLKVKRDGVEEVIDLPLEAYPILFTFPIFTIPRYLSGVKGTGVDLEGWHTVNFGAPVESLRSKFAGQEIELRSEVLHPVALARMIAKIGYCVAYAEGRLTRIEGPSPVLPSILGEADDIGHWVGTLGDVVRKYPGVLHRIAVREDPSSRLLIADVQLFSDSESPTYGVILGRLR